MGEGYQRVWVKLSGEMLAPKGGHGLDTEAVLSVAREVALARNGGVEVGIVLGAGNLVRGAGPNPSGLKITRHRLDTMGMLATCINGVALKDGLEAIGVDSVLMSTFSGVPGIPQFDADVASRHLSAGRVVICSGGTGLPYFSTDTAAAVRALEVRAEVLIKGTQVDGVFDRDPRGPDGDNAVFLPSVTFSQVLEMQLNFMDLSAIAICSQHRLPVIVYNAHGQGNLAGVLAGRLTSSRVGPD